MKNIITVLCLLVLALCLSGCNEGVVETNKDEIQTRKQDVIEIRDDLELSNTTTNNETVSFSESDKEDIINEEKQEIKNNEVIVESSKTEKKKNEQSKKDESTQTKEEVKVDNPVPVPKPTSPEEPSVDDPKEEPKIEEEIVYSGWHESDKAKKVFNIINSIREENGLSTLPWNDSDTWLANTRVEELVDEVAKGTVHSGLKKYDRYVGEIAGYGYSPNGVVNAWMQSKGHANQILADYNTSMAVGVYYDEYTSSSYYIVIFR